MSSELLTSHYGCRAAEVLQCACSRVSFIFCVESESSRETSCAWDVPVSGNNPWLLVDMKTPIGKSRVQDLLGYSLSVSVLLRLRLAAGSVGTRK